MRPGETGYRHLLRVRIGVHGPKGRLTKCARKDGTGFYWKVRLDSGEWVWPADLVIDGPGDGVARCAECEMRFMCTAVVPLCPGCDEQMFGTQQRAAEPGTLRTFDRGFQHRPINKPRHS